MESFKEIQEMLKGLKYESLQDKHFKVAMKAVTTKIDEVINSSTDATPYIMDVNAKLDEYIKNTGEQIFPLQSDLLLIMSAFEAVIKMMKEENEKFVDGVLEETQNRLK